MSAARVDGGDSVGIYLICCCRLLESVGGGEFEEGKVRTS